MKPATQVRIRPESLTVHVNEAKAARFRFGNGGAGVPNPVKLFGNRPVLVEIRAHINAVETKAVSLLVAPLGLTERIENATGIAYDDIQMEAILTAAQSKILILTGGSGTGKTTTMLGIITAFREAGAQILLAAPTGRAAKRLAETTGMEYKTIHRLLETKPPDGYQRNADNPLEGDVLIVDECSMIDVMLMYNLLKAVPDAMTLIFVGDIDQLPSVGAGNVLRERNWTSLFWPTRNTANRPCRSTRTRSLCFTSGFQRIEPSRKSNCWRGRRKSARKTPPARST